jgi:outer membrane receptor protein involved in Fe transport
LPRVWYPNYTYHDFRLDISPNNRFRFYFGIDNAFDKRPPFDLLGVEAGSPYDPVGRFFYAGAEVKF